MTTVRWSDSAIRDLQLVRHRLEADRPDIAQQVINRIVLSTDLLLQTAGIGTPVGYRRWRNWRVRRTAHLIMYQAERSGLTVVRALHERSDWVATIE